MDVATYNKKEARKLMGYTLAQVLVKDGVMRLVFTDDRGKVMRAAVMDILQDPEGNGPGFADVMVV